MNQLLKLSINDLKLIFRDPPLRSFFGLPLVLFAVILFLVPYIIEKYDFLDNYIHLVMVIAVIENTQLFSFIMSMVFIDEKESGVNKVYGVLPVNKSGFTLSRLVFSYLFTTVLNVILFLVQPFYEISLVANLLLSFSIALIVPVYILGINTFVKNKLEGMIYVKVFNIVVLLPFAGFFLPGMWQYVFAWIPTHWLFQSIANLFQGEPYLLELGIGCILFILLLIFLTRKFIKNHFT